VLLTRGQDRFGRQAYNYAGAGRDDGSAVTPPAPELTEENTNRDERSTEWYLRDAMRLSPRWSLWAGLRHTRLARESVRTDGSRPIDVTQSFTTPWLALTHRLDGGTLLYASWGQGVEAEVAPNRSRYTTAGQARPARKSEQAELGARHEAANGGPSWTLAAFRIARPLAADIGACDVDGSCTRRIDGEAVHRGVEGQIEARLGDWGWQAGAMWLDAERRGSVDAPANGLRPVNVPERTLKAMLTRRLAAWPAAQASLAMVHEGPRMVLPDNRIEAPGWTRLDLGLRGEWRSGGAAWTWRVGVDNLTDERAWRDTPYQFGHAYLFPMPPRTFALSVQASL
jgi:iron complex outermembrane receptor protein